MLGAGSRFKAGEDGDLAMRALLAGHWIYETPVVWVTHYGLRKWEQLPALIDSYWHGTARSWSNQSRPAMASIALLLRLAGKWVLGRSRVGASLGRQHRLMKLQSFCQGFLAGQPSPSTSKRVFTSALRKTPSRKPEFRSWTPCIRARLETCRRKRILRALDGMRRPVSRRDAICSR